MTRTPNGRASVLAISAVLGALTAAALEGQQLFTIVDEPAGASRTASSAVGSEALERDAAEVAIEADLELLRSGPERLDLLTPDRDVLTAERTWFEDRGHGNVLWRGRVPGHPHDTVVLTLHEDHILGQYGGPGAMKFEVLTRAGNNYLIKPVRAPGTLPRLWCDSRPVVLPAAAEARSAATSDVPDVHIQLPQMAQAQLDILVLYTTATRNLIRDTWLIHFGAELQATADYANLVIGNTNINARLNIVAVAPSPADVLTAVAGGTNPNIAARDSSAVQALRTRYGADIVYSLIDSAEPYVAGQAWTRTSRFTIQHMSSYAFALSNYRYGDTSIMRRAFIHEIGHVLGMNHDAANYIQRPDDGPPLYPYAFGYTDSSQWPAIATVMSYGALDTP